MEACEEGSEAAQSSSALL